MGDDAKKFNHIGLLQKVLLAWTDIERGAFHDMLDIAPAEITAALADLGSLELPVPLLTQRLNLMTSLLMRRLELLKEITRD